MRLPTALLSLPPSLLLLFAAHLRAQELESPQVQLPTAVKKMSLDEGEKFLPEYYAFAPSDSLAHAQSPLRPRAALLTPEEEVLLSLNSSAAIAFRPPVLKHYDYHQHSPSAAATRPRTGARDDARQDAAEGGGESLLYRRARDALARLQGRQFACPGGTHACTNIDQPNYCCVDDAVCFVVTGAADAGNVGCCPSGRNCGGSVGTCSDDGSTACAAEVGGGCCIPGFVCADVGCVSSTVSVITQTTTTSTVISSPSPTTQIITVIITITPSDTDADTSTVTQTTTADTSTATATTTETDTDTNGGGIPPVRPTSSGSDTTSDADYCPTGFYACVASAGAGCCRTGRDCSTTSCPPPAMTTITTDGATVVVPVTDADAAAATTGADAAESTCAGGWFLCGDDAGPVAGCCPSGYACGTASCTLSAATATATVQKELPNGAAGALGAMGRRVVGALGSAFVIGGLLVVF